jgi:hypothetical protein
VISSKSQDVFDEVGRQIETRNYQYDFSGESQTVFRYTDFDECGNWQRRVTEYIGTGGASKDHPVMTRTIEYY